MRDEEYFKDPLLFSPDRFLDKTTGDDPPKIGALDVDPGILVFGFGRRWNFILLAYKWYRLAHVLIIQGFAQEGSSRKERSGWLLLPPWLFST